MPSRERIAIFIPSFGTGGVERMLVNLAVGFSDRRIGVDFILNRAKGPYLSALPETVRVIELKCRHRITILKKMTAYLGSFQPTILLSAKDGSDITGVLARRLSGSETRVFIRAVVNVTQRLEHRNILKKRWTYYWMRRLYRHADGILAVSKGVAEDVRRITGLAHDRIHTVPNPVITRELASLSLQTVDHPWFSEKNQPIIIGVGRMGRQKNFSLLIRSFAAVHQTRPCRLVILGGGRQRGRLIDLAQKLGVARDVWLPGFVENPYAFIAKADLFVLSSKWEGSPNALTEALALGIPVVSTDCPSGPREILDGGRYGPLVAPNDICALSKAIIDTLSNPLPGAFLKSAAADYSVPNSTMRYLAAMGIAEIRHT